MKAYYDKRASEYDSWYLGTGVYADRDRPGWHEEMDALLRSLEALPPARTLDVACGTGFLTRHLPGELTGLDQSPAMLAIAAVKVLRASLVCGDALALPFPDGAFDRVFTGHFYGHLETEERLRFLAEARRVAPELVVVDSALREGVAAEEWQERQVSDGSRFVVYKRYFTAEGLAEEVGAGEILLAGRYFVAVRAQTGTTAD